MFCHLNFLVYVKDFLKKPTIQRVYRCSDIGNCVNIGNQAGPVAFKREFKDNKLFRLRL